MSKVRSGAIIVAVLLTIGLLVLGGLAIHRVGWTQGYRIGQQMGEEAGEVPYAPQRFGYPGLLVVVGVTFLSLLIVGKFFFRLFMWRSIGARWAGAGGPWTRHWRHPHGPVPPWWEPGGEAQPEAGPNEA